MSIARQRLGKSFPAGADTQATKEELLGTMFPIRSVPRGCEKDKEDPPVWRRGRIPPL
jgi:hypothetical protein